VRLLSAQVKRSRLPKGLDEFLVDYLDHHLGRVERFGDFRPNRAFFHPVGECLDHGVINIRLKQRQPHFAHRLFNILLA